MSFLSQLKRIFRVGGKWVSVSSADTLILWCWCWWPQSDNNRSRWSIHCSFYYKILTVQSHHHHHNISSTFSLAFFAFFSPFSLTFVLNMKGGLHVAAKIRLLVFHDMFCVKILLSVVFLVIIYHERKYTW